VIRRTKIVATLGPGTGTPDRVTALLEAGVNVVRINASHGSPDVRAQWMALVRESAARLELPVAVLVDLQGPRIRVGDLAEPRTLVPGETLVFAPEEVASGDELPTTYEALARDVRPGSRILLNDGLLAVEVTQVAAPRVEARVVDGGVLTSHKGMNLPGVQVSAPALTEKDREDVAHAVRHGADYVALSFVQRAEDLTELRAVVPASVRLVAKIEKAAALEDLDRILQVCDAVMGRAVISGSSCPSSRCPSSRSG
jgi:pyruvate kinase